MRRRDLMAADNSMSGIDFAYITIDQTQSNEQQMITVRAKQGGAVQHLNTTTGIHENLALQRLRDSSHLYIGDTVYNNKLNVIELDDNNGTIYADTGNSAGVSSGSQWMRITLPFYIKRISGSDGGDQVTYGIAVGEQPDSTWKQLITPNDLLGVHKAVASDTGNNGNGVLYAYSGNGSTRPTCNISASNFKKKARNKGNGFTLVTWEWHCVMALLFWGWYGRTNSQAQCGYNQLSDILDSGDNTFAIGTTDTLGMNDTNLSTMGTNQSPRFWGIEDWWGNAFEFMDNIRYYSSSNGVCKYSVTDVKTDSIRYVSTNVNSSSVGYITKLLLTKDLDLLPSSVSVQGGSNTTYYCDSTFASNVIEEGPGTVLRGGYGTVKNGGITALLTLDSSNHSLRGTRLAYHGDIGIISPVIGEIG